MTGFADVRSMRSAHPAAGHRCHRASIARAPRSVHRMSISRGLSGAISAYWTRCKAAAILGPRLARATAMTVVIPGASHLFEEPGALDRVAWLAGSWFIEHFAARRAQARAS